MLVYDAAYLWLMQRNTKSQQHPKDFPGGHPPQYYPGLAVLNFGVRKGSGVFNAVWPLTKSDALRQPTYNAVSKS